MKTNKIAIEQIVQGEKTDQAYSRAAACIVSMFNGNKRGDLTSGLHLHDSFCTNQSLLIGLGVASTEEVRDSVRYSIIEDAAPLLAVMIADKEAIGEWNLQDGFTGLDIDVAEGWALTVGAQLEQRLRSITSNSLTMVDDWEEGGQCCVWARHVYRLGQLSIQVNEGDAIMLDGNAPNLWTLVDIYNDAAHIIIRFWVEITSLAQTLLEGANNGADPALPFMASVFNKRFKEARQLTND